MQQLCANLRSILAPDQHEIDPGPRALNSKNPLAGVRRTKLAAQTSWWRLLLIGAIALALQAAVLLAMGQPAICTCGTVKVWHGLIFSSENSQHLTDWYTFSHIIHGFGFYLLAWLVTPRSSIALRFALALGLEVGWEILENTPLIIGRYRQSAMAQGYVGDSVVNSMFDTIAMSAGFWLARLLPTPATVAVALALELSIGYAVRDNFTLNVVQLVYPTEAITGWQTRP